LLIFLIGGLPRLANSATCTEHPATPGCLAKSGKANEASTAYDQLFAALEAKEDWKGLWSELMGAAWLAEGLGEPKRAVEYSNRALEIAYRLDDDRRIGQTWAWLGWSYTSVGLYELALEFFDRAIEVGAPNGVITHVQIWGIATQEKGWVWARLGDLKRGKALLIETTDYARERDICPGLAEGSPHVAYIALLQGDLREAQRYADEGVAASERCGGGTTYARALAMSAKVAIAKSVLDRKQRDAARMKTDKALAYAESVRDKRQIAAAQLLQAELLPPEENWRRIELAQSALDLLTETESELQSQANAGLGRMFVENEQKQLARFYTEIGLEIAESLFQEVDSAYILGDLADLDFEDDKLQDELAKREEAAERAEAAGALPRALEEMEVLSEEYLRLGYSRIAASWSKSALAVTDRLLDRKPEKEFEKNLLARKQRLVERLAEIAFELGDMAPGQEAY
jgi:tetratricopeptide (TPR) repeat protein